MISSLPVLCGTDGCLRILGHAGQHDERPSEAWSFLQDIDKNKIAKAGFATPRGGAKGAYQNHVIRSSKVIVPFERMNDVALELFKDGYVVRLLPEQYFCAPRTPRAEFLGRTPTLIVGQNAFLLYRTHQSLEAYPPLSGWEVRGLLRGGQGVSRRGVGVEDTGHYVLRIPRLGNLPKRYEGPPQGVFAPEYADDATNYLCKCVLAWLIVQTSGSPYTNTQARHLRAILCHYELDNVEQYERTGVLKRGLTSCPLCLRIVAYAELHSMVTFDNQSGLTNAAEQIDGSTRSTVVNLFHVLPLLYHELTHGPHNIGWGHAVCNTRLGQRPCHSLADLVDANLKVGVVLEEGLIETFGWISNDWQMIRSPNGAVWMQLNGDVEEGAPVDEDVFDAANGSEVELDGETPAGPSP